jgi:hypothetical protein
LVTFYSDFREREPSAPARLLMLKEIIAERSFNRTDLLVSSLHL